MATKKKKVGAIKPVKPQPQQEKQSFDFPVWLYRVKKGVLEEKCFQSVDGSEGWAINKYEAGVPTDAIEKLKFYRKMESLIPTSNINIKKKYEEG